jgi:hypothetical protein
VVGAAGGGGDEPGRDLLAVDEQRPEEQRLEPEREQESERSGRGGEGRRDRDDDRDDERVERLDEHGGGELGQPCTEEVVAGTREDPDHERDGREAQQHECEDLGEDDRQRERAKQHDGAERADEHDDGEREALVGAARLLYVDRGGVGLGTR